MSNEAPVKRRLAAILAADVVGYSKLIGEDETSTLAPACPRSPSPSATYQNKRCKSITGGTEHDQEKGMVNETVGLTRDAVSNDIGKCP